jgi:hypothetical protein
MSRSLKAIIFILIVCNGLLLWDSAQLQSRLAAAESELATISQDSKEVSELLQSTGDKLEALKAPPPTTSPKRPAQAPASPKSPVSQLALAQSYKLDRVVDWIGLIEGKIYFLLFPPLDPQLKARQAEDLQRRTDDIKAQFESVSQQELALRALVMQRLQEPASGVEDRSK